MSEKGLGICRFNGPKVIVASGEDDRPEEWWVGRLTEDQQDHVERALRRAYELGRNDMKRDLRQMLGV